MACQMFSDSFFSPLNALKLRNISPCAKLDTHHGLETYIDTSTYCKIKFQLFIAGGTTFQ